MTILNMNYGANKGGANIGEPTNISATATSDSATITWTDNDLNTIPPSTFLKSVLVRKVGSAPTSPSDGTTVVTETVKNTYSSNGYTDTGLTGGTTYYYQVFSYSDLGGITYGTPTAITPSSSRLPAEYQEVEYIDNGGNAYINTGVTASNTLSLEFYFTPSNTNISAILGDWWSDQGIFFMFYDNGYRLHNGGTVVDVAGATTNKTKIEITPTAFIVNGASNACVAGSGYSSGTTIALFNTMNNRGFGGPCNAAFYETKIWDNGTLIRDMVPCYRIADSVAGMYDVVNNVFYTNIGGGSFTPGPDVN